MLEVKTYSELHDFVKAFAKKQLNFLTIVGKGGLGKSYIVENALIETGPLIFSAHVTPLKMYLELFERNLEEKDFIVVFDDVDALMLNKTNIALLKQICDTRNEKIVKYFTTTPILKDIPNEFRTNCKVVMLMNNLEPEEPNLKALMTRAHLIYFNPPDIEILNYMKTFAKDQEILDFIERFAHFSKNLNLRVYVRAKELKDSGLDWKKEVISELKVDPRLLEIHDLLKKYQTDKEREEHFSQSKATYWRLKRVYLSKNPVSVSR